MSCMADVHEVQEANDKSKFHRQIKTCWSVRQKQDRRMSLTSESPGCSSIETAHSVKMHTTPSFGCFTTHVTVRVSC